LARALGIKKKTSAEKESGSTREEKTCITESIVTKVRTFQFIDRSKIFLILAFLIPIGLRAIPEVLMGHFVVGFDPLGYYIPYTLTWLREGVSLWPFLGAAPFLYLLMIGITWIGVPIVFSLKVMSPLLLGFLGLAIFFYAKKTLLWSSKKSLLAALFATLYFVALRVSWDMLRSELALIFLFVALILLEKIEKPSTNVILILSLTMFLVVFSNQLVGAMMIIIIVAALVRLFLRKKTQAFYKLLVCSAPVLLLFCIILYVDATSPHYSAIANLAQNSESIDALLGPISSADMSANTAAFFLFCYLPLIPLFITGFKRSKLNFFMKTWLSFLIILIVIILVSGNVFFGILPYRLVILLTYPLSFYAVDAFSKLKSYRYRVFIGVILATFTICFVTLPYNSPFVYYRLFPTYVPGSMLMNTVPLSDCQDTKIALHWAEDNMSNTNRLLTHNAFYGWAILEMNDSQIVPYGFGNADAVAQELTKKNSSYEYYLIWWVDHSGWYAQPPLSSHFQLIYQSGRIGVFAYSPTF
jgi:hypothetical protein